MTNKKKNWFSNLLFNMKAAIKWDTKLFYYQFLPVLPGVVSTYLGLLIPAELVRGLENQWSIEYLVLYICILSLGMLIFGVVQQGMEEYIYRNSPTLTMYYETLCYDKIMRLDYSMLQEPAYTKLIGNTWNVLRNEYGTRTSVSIVPALLSGLLGVVWYGFMIGRNSLVIVLLAVIQTLVNALMARQLGKKHEKYHKEVGKFARQTAYISTQVMDRRAGKDMRIYQMQKWFLQKYEDALIGMDGIYKRIHDGNFCKCVVDAGILLLLNGFSYIYLISLLGRDKISVSEFVLLIGLIGSFSGALSLFMNQVLQMNWVSISLGYIRSFLELEESPNWSEGIDKETFEAMKERPVSIQLDKVSFRYPKEKEDTLSDISLTIQPGEKLALIGLNGAGKTTLVKLLSGFYRPTGGEILLNDIPVSQFSKAQYRELVTVLFQDSTLLPLTLDCNLTGEKSERIDREKLDRALRLSDFKTKYEELTEKGNTLLVPEANQTATDFSGGERQKMLFARALYKDSPLMILDEPTAALDPIAENRMYQNFAEAAKGKTCVYISHRLSSTRFCDRILLLKEGQIVEEGTHDSLMEQNGEYAELYEMQSKYYREQERKADYE